MGTDDVSLGRSGEGMGRALPPALGYFTEGGSSTADYLSELEAAIAAGEVEVLEYERSQQAQHTQGFAVGLAMKNAASLLGQHGVFPQQNEFGDAQKFQEICHYLVVEERNTHPGKLSERIESLVKTGKSMKKRATIDSLYYAVMQARAARDGFGVPRR